MSLRGIILKGRVRVAATSAILSIPPLDLPSTVELSGSHWLAKKELHVTLLGRDAMESIGRGSRGPVVVRDAAKGMELEVRLTDELWLLEEPPASTIIARAEVPDAAELFAKISDASGAKLEEPPYHVTLFTRGTSRGIGVHSLEELRSAGRELTDAERKRLLDQIRDRGE